MLEILGVDYLFQHIINSYVKEQQQKQYEVYVADTLQAISESLAHISPNGKYMPSSWSELNGTGTDKKETRSAEEIIEHIKKGLAENA